MNRFFPAFAVCVCILFSCSNPQNSEFADIDYADTVKINITEASGSVTWTAEIEPDVLEARKMSAADGFKVSGLSSVESVLLLAPETGIYPSVTGFGSLDTSSFSPELRNMLNSFCSDLQAYHNTAADPEKLYGYMNTERAFMLTVFLYDLRTLPRFSRYIFGKPFDYDIFRQIPVRFYTKGGYMDLYLYAVQSGSSWRVDQITYGAFVYE